MFYVDKKINSIIKILNGYCDNIKTIFLFMYFCLTAEYTLGLTDYAHRDQLPACLRDH